MDNQTITLAVTGGTGFIARGVYDLMATSNLMVRALSRGDRPEWAPPRVKWRTVTSYSDPDDLADGLKGASHVLHLADSPERTDLRSGAEALRNADALIHAMRRNRIERIAIASSVYARNSDAGEGSYAAVKRTVEGRFLGASDLRAIVLRLPPVYGPGGKGGLATLSSLVARGFPLPLGAARAPRAYLSRRNFASLVLALVNADEAHWNAAAGRIFEPSDGQAVATRDLIGMMAAQLGRQPRLLPVPLVLLRAIGVVVGRSEMIAGATEALEVAGADEMVGFFGWLPEEQMPQSLSFLKDR
ncbi:MAG: NAD(P)H-binding protein [Sphingopyxis sp.]|uniref:NAD-dependent epimerase/dehydratase family protein n=1 Tax=Sphingopyxis sp. TaxID=1908224 RepID=UPI001A4500C0|nr:NAD-dependent epimerase/dehydratase family protein [Sphingopyxis sp.]MBL9071709.1 NAD(P)H-binding protein [Sphingopyxis sp.]